MTFAKIRDEFTKISGCLTRTKSKVFNKFLVEMILGISRSLSLNLSRISVELEKELKPKARHIHKKIVRLLGACDLLSVKEKIQRQQCKEIDVNTSIYYDPTEIVKPCGVKFENLSKVRDGSRSTPKKLIIEKGYPLTCCIALKDEKIIPLDLELGSYTDINYDSENQKHLEYMLKISDYSNGKGVFILDQGFDGFSIIRGVCDRNIKFIIRMGENRKYYVAGDRSKIYERHEIIKEKATISTTAYMEFKRKKSLKTFKFKLDAVEVDLLGGEIKDHKLTLIRGKCKDLTLYVLTNLQDITKESITEIFISYINRWKIEEYIRFLKQQYKLEGVRTFYYLKTQNLIRLLFITTVVLIRLSEFGLKFSKVRSVLIKKAARTYKLPQNMRFFLYSLADGLANLLRDISSKVVKMMNKIDPKQMRWAF
jgi:hypothetical protein